MGNDYQLSESSLYRIYAALASEVRTHFGITAAGGIFRAAGLLPKGDQQYWTPLMEGIDRQFREFDLDEKLRTVRILAQRLIQEDQPEVSASVERLLRDHGFLFIDGGFVPVDVFDEREKHFLPASSASEISKALGRLVSGDSGGALTSACGAVETAAAGVYREKSLGDIAKVDSFQRKVMAAIEASGKLSELEAQLVGLGWTKEHADRFCKNLGQVFNQAGYLMQTLRSHMSDAHGKKPVVESVVFDALKLASVLVSFMK